MYGDNSFLFLFFFLSLSHQSITNPVLRNDYTLFHGDLITAGWWLNYIYKKKKSVPCVPTTSHLTAAPPPALPLSSPVDKRPPPCHSPAASQIAWQPSASSVFDFLPWKHGRGGSENEPLSAGASPRPLQIVHLRWRWVTLSTCCGFLFATSTRTPCVCVILYRCY